MKIKLMIAALAMTAVCFAASYGQANNAQPPVKKHVATKKNHASPPPVAARKAKKPAGPSVEEQIQGLRAELEKQASKIDSLQTGLAEKDAQLKQAQQTDLA